MQMKQMGPVLKTSFTQALNGAGVTQTLQRINQTMMRMSHLQAQVEAGRGNITGLKKGITRETSKYYGNKAGGYVPNFAGVMMNNQEKLVRNYRQKTERAKVQGSGGYTAGQKGAAVPRWAGGFNPKNDAIFNPGMMAGGYVPNFAPNTGSMSLEALIQMMQASQGNRFSGNKHLNRQYRDQLAHYYKSVKRGVGAHGGTLAGKSQHAAQRLWSSPGSGRMQSGIKAFSGRVFKGGDESIRMGASTYAPDHMGRYMNKVTRADNLNQIKLQGEAKLDFLANDSSWKTSKAKTMRVGSGNMNKRQRLNDMFNKGGRRFGNRNLSNYTGGRNLAPGRGTFQRGQMAKYLRLKRAGQLGRHTSFLGGGMQLGGMGARGMHMAGMAGRAGMMGAKGLVRGAFGVPGMILEGGDLLGKAAGWGTEWAVGRKVSDDDKDVGAWNWVPGASNIARSVKATSGIVSGDFSRRGDSAGIKQSRLRMENRLKNNPKALAEYKRQLKKNLRSEKADPGFWGTKVGAANGYIPNFAGYGQGTSFSGLFGGAAKQIQARQWKDSQGFKKFGAPGMGHMFKSQYSGAAMNTPGLRGEMMRRMGVTGGEAFKTYPKVGSFHAGGHVPNFYGGIAASQARERSQSGRSDVYTKMINGFGPATFNGSERGMENMIVRNHPNPRSAGMAEGHIPNFANLSKDLKSVSENIGLLNENMSMSGGDSGGQTSGNLSISMGEMRVSLYGGNPSQELQTSLTDQLAVFQNEVQSTLSAMAPDTYAAMKGPPVV
jgi:hypothetical protein